MPKSKEVGEKAVGTLTCPICGYKQKMEIPRDMCIQAYKCNGCGNLIYRKEKCCIFCDYGDKPCYYG